jgi:MOSC domain-containing protein YiiM
VTKPGNPRDQSHDIRIDSLLTGPVAPLGPKGVPSGIDKRPVGERVWLGREGFAGDAQGDRRHHGGPDKAVHHYTRDHYPRWQAELGDLPLLRHPGAFGENFSTGDLDEGSVAVGDVFRAGQALIEVSQGRQPCWRLNLRFGVPDMARRVQDSGRTGWYYRVLEPGFVSPGDALQLLERRSPDWTVDRLRCVLYVNPLDRQELSAMAALAHLPEGWRRLALRRLEANAVEDWSGRLQGSP